jgi:hypothetical protein
MYLSILAECTPNTKPSRASIDTYLGIEVNDTLDKRLLSEHVVKRTGKAVGMATPLLCKCNVPRRLKVWVMRNCLNPIATYGARRSGAPVRTRQRLCSPKSTTTCAWCCP